MPEAVFEDMKRYIGFGPRDAIHLRELAPHAAPHLPAVVDRFYREILGHPDTRGIMMAEPERLTRLRRQFTEWLRTLFCGTYDLDYCRRRSEIGRTHVRVGLPQHFMFAAMEVVWQELETALSRSGAADMAARLASLHKLLLLETAIMLESYKERYSERVRQVERRTMEERLTKSEHLAHIGQLAASLAHEIKNPLAGISGAIQVIRDGLPPGDAKAPILEEVLRQINRLDRTVKDLLEYARPKLPQFQACDLGAVVTRVLTVLRGEPEGKRVRIEHLCPAPLPPIEADERQIEQLLLNLAQNAVQASKERGLVRVVTAEHGAYVRLSVEDQGGGMNEETRRRAFEPFFTTKARGTGLGLSICQKIVDAHGGEIMIQSAVGQGTTVIVDLPRQPPVKQEPRSP